MAESKKQRHPRDFKNMDEKAILTRVMSDIEVSKQFQQPYFDRFDEYYKLYRSFIDEQDVRKDRSNLFIPYTFHIIETITPKVITSLFATRPYVQTIPLGVDSSVRYERSEKMNKFLDYQFQQKIKVVPVITDVVKTALTYGTAITKHTWEFKTKKMIVKRPKKILGIELPIFDEVLEDVVVKDHPMVQNIPIKDFFFDPSATNIDDARYCAHRYYEDYHELKSKEEKTKDSEYKYKNIDKLKDSEIPFSSENTEDMLTNIGLSGSTGRKKGIKLIEYWTDDWKIVVANDSVVIYSGRNPYYHKSKPFAKWVDTPVPNEFYGIGEIEPVKHLQYELNTTRNQRIDNVALILNKMYKVVRGANVDPAQFISRPGGFIELDDLDDIKEMDFKDVTSSAYNEESIIKGDIDKTLGVYDTARGSSPDRRETATTMSILSNASGERFRIKTMLIENGGFHEMINQIIRLNQQYIDRPLALQILGEDGKFEDVDIRPNEILGEYDIVAVGSSVEPVVNKEVRQNQLIQLLNVIRDNPNVNHQEFLKRLFESFDMKNLDVLLTTQAPSTDMGEQAQMPNNMPASYEQMAEAHQGGTF